MKMTYRKTVLAGMVAAFFASPALAAGTASEQSDLGQEPAAATTGVHTGAAAGMHSDLRAMTPRDLEGVQVVDATGQEVGEIKSIVHSRADDTPHAVISAGGFMGIADREIVVSLDELQWSGDRLQVSQSLASLEGTPQFAAEQYVEVQPADQPISEFSAFEPLPQESQQYTPEQLPQEDPRQSSDIAPRHDLQHQQQQQQPMTR